MNWYPEFMKFVKKVIYFVLNKFGYVVLKTPEVARLGEDSFPRAYLDLLAQSPSTSAIKVSEAQEIISNAKSQIGQDILALCVNGLKRNGFFVEFGATDGVELSNTFILEKKFGWTGILCEPGNVWHKELAKNRNCFIDTRCVWSQSDELVDFAQASTAFLSTVVDFQDSDLHAEARANSLVYQVKTVSLRDLLRSYNAPLEIDFLSIDTEGSEYSILRDFDFGEYRFNLICVEHNYTSSRDKLFDLLVSNGYKRVHTELSKFDDWYVRSDNPMYSFDR
jgi:FkbM family methyltransferase